MKEGILSWHLFFDMWLLKAKSYIFDVIFLQRSGLINVNRLSLTVINTLKAIFGGVPSSKNANDFPKAIG